MIELKQYATERGVKPALIKKGRKYIYVLTMDNKLTVRKVALTEERYMCELVHKRKPYPMRRALVRFRSFGRSHGTSKSAKRFLTEASKQIKETS